MQPGEQIPELNLSVAALTPARTVEPRSLLLPPPPPPAPTIEEVADILSRHLEARSRVSNEKTSVLFGKTYFELMRIINSKGKTDTETKLAVLESYRAVMDSQHPIVVTSVRKPLGSKRVRGNTTKH